MHANEHPTGGPGHHSFDPKSGYKQEEYQHQEYPKHVNGVLVKNAAEEKAVLAKAAAAEQSEPKAE